MPWIGPIRFALAAIALSSLAACQEQEAAEPAPPAQRINLQDLRVRPAEPIESPDTTLALWRVSESGQSIRFGVADAPPLLTLACSVRADPPELQIIRHAPAQPGAKALFPVIGNGTISRFKVDAQLREGEWRWEGALPADDPLWDVFTGAREIEATLPGGGSLVIRGSTVPREFVRWCEAGGGQLQETREAEADGEESAES